MQDPALRWVALALACAGRPGARRQAMERWNRAPADAPQASWDAGADGASPDGSGVSRSAAGWLEAARAEIERARRLGFSILTPADEDYPPLLRGYVDPPAALYLSGRLQPADRLAVAIVGVRRATPQGEAVAGRIAEGLAARGFTIVSGLARGIDAAAHRGALRAGGRTIALLGSGPDRIYPAEHRTLAEAIAASGAVATELRVGTSPLPRHFPERNRLIAALAWATVVVEAARDSGSLITADLAAEAGRTVFAVPGAVGEPNAEGPNALLRSGAVCCRGAEDVLEDLAPQIVAAAAGVAAARAAAGALEGGAATRPAAVSGDAAGSDAGAADAAGGKAAAPDADVADAPGPAARRVLDALPATRGLTIEELARRTGLAPGPLQAAVLELELGGFLTQRPGARVLRKPAPGCRN